MPTTRRSCRRSRTWPRRTERSVLKPGSRLAARPGCPSSQSRTADAMATSRPLTSPLRSDPTSPECRRRCRGRRQRLVSFEQSPRRPRRLRSPSTLSDRRSATSTGSHMRRRCRPDARHGVTASVTSRNQGRHRVLVRSGRGIATTSSAPPLGHLGIELAQPRGSPRVPAGRAAFERPRPRSAQ